MHGLPNLQTANTIQVQMTLLLLQWGYTFVWDEELWTHSSQHEEEMLGLDVWIKKFQYKYWQLKQYYRRFFREHHLFWEAFLVICERVAVFRRKILLILRISRQKCHGLGNGAFITFNQQYTFYHETFNTLWGNLTSPNISPILPLYSWHFQLQLPIKPFGAISL